MQIETEQGNLTPENSHYLLAAEVGGFGFWTYYPDSDRMFLSNEFVSLIQSEGSPHIRNKADFLSIILPQDQLRMRGLLNSASLDESVKRSKVRLQLPNGEVVPTICRCRFIAGSSDKPDRIVGVMRSIAELDVAPTDAKEQLYRNMLRKCGDVFYETDFLTRSYRYIDIGIELMTGIPVQDFTMQQWPMITEQSVLKGALEKMTEQEASLAMERGDVDFWEVEYLINSREGRKLWIQDTAVLIRNEQGKPIGSLGLLKDITKTRFADKQNKHELRVGGAVAAAGVIAWSHHLEDNSTYCTDDPEIFVGFKEAFSLAKKRDISNIIFPGDCARVKSAVQQCCASGEPLDVEFRSAAPGASERWFSARGRVVYNVNGLPSMIAGLCWEVTEQKKIQSQLFQSQKMETIGSMAGGMAHDFNNLLQIILGFAEFARSGMPNEGYDKAKTALDRVETAANSAAELTRHLLAVARKQPSNPRTFDLNVHIREMLPILNGLIGSSLSISLNLSETECFLNVDPVQIEQLLLNLCANARDAMPDGGTVSISTSAVSLDKRTGTKLQGSPSAGSYVCLEVTDTGTGMDSETLSRIFEPFFTTKERNRGTGLGLAICDGVVRQCKGGLRVESSLGVGTSIFVYLPRVHKQAVVYSVPKQLRADFSVRTLLVVDDNPRILELITSALQSETCKILTASSGVEALQIAYEYEGHIDLLVTDVVMPGISGTLLASRMEAIRSNLPVLYMSGYAEQSSLLDDSKLELGRNLLEKPFSLSVLRQTVETALAMMT